VQPFWRTFGHGEANPAAQRDAEIEGLRKLERIEDGHDICGITGKRVGGGVMGFVAGAAPANIDKDTTILLLEPLDIPQIVPCLQGGRGPVLEDERGTITVDLVVDAKTLAVAIWHVSALL
jgi:hypothetical protein